MFVQALVASVTTALFVHGYRQRWQTQRKIWKFSFVDNKIIFQKSACVPPLLINLQSIFPWNVATEGEVIFQELICMR